MNGRMARKIRRESILAARKRDEKILPELKSFINRQSLLNRIKLAWRLVCGRF